MANNRAASCHCRSLNWLPLRNVLVRCVNVFLQWGQRNRCLRRASFPNRNAPAAPQCRQKILCAAIFVEGSFSRSHFYSLPSTQMGSTARLAGFSVLRLPAEQEHHFGQLTDGSGVVAFFFPNFLPAQEHGGECFVLHSFLGVLRKIFTRAHALCEECENIPVDLIESVDHLMGHWHGAYLCSLNEACAMFFR